MQKRNDPPATKTDHLSLCHLKPLSKSWLEWQRSDPCYRQALASAASNASKTPLPTSESLNSTQAQQPPEVLSAGVLWLWQSTHQRLHLIMIRRSRHKGSHRGQIAFAGGRVEARDHSPADTALRETEEEIGLKRADVCLLGELPAQLDRSGHPVVTVVGILSEDVNPTFKPCPNEVDEVLMIPMEAFERKKDQAFAYTFFGQQRTSHAFRVNRDEYVWGLTASIIAAALPEDAPSYPRQSTTD